MYKVRTSAGNFPIKEIRHRRPQNLDNLTMDAMRAQAAGVSYGKYKAQHHETVAENDEIRAALVAEDKKRRAERAAARESKAGKPARQIFRKTCPVCGTVFETSLPSKKYCGDVCKNKVNTARYRERWAKEKEARKKMIDFGLKPCPLRRAMEE